MMGGGQSHQEVLAQHLFDGGEVVTPFCRVLRVGIQKPAPDQLKGTGSQEGRQRLRGAEGKLLVPLSSW